ncbi:Mitochondrial distribution and morphology protein 31, mitochondrial precursor [Puccinia graminis f. sp. tritici]|uniref:Mitochondrial distribution and morphology protein 31, mitochondrial n=1 Tax=Puccinia graminis f. sp. tritici TaxID=56615 RepID=A0A5B0Q9H6_PUCGR|nr:Mitochondrial distribution and morphology protein 31, mitochondrial precursor [Puccinia graminis f. sp. tritici]
MIAEGLVTFCIALLSPKKELPTSLKDSPPAKKNSTSTSISAPKPKKPHPKRTSQVSSDEDGDFSDPPSNDEINQRTGDENDDNHHPSSKRNGLISERRNLIKLDLKSPNVEESFKKMMNCTCSETIKKLKNKLPSS